MKFLGKTTAARAMAKLLKREGLLPTSKMVELNGECK
jgi:Mg-chelatase subunit ChlI